MQPGVSNATPRASRADWAGTMLVRVALAIGIIVGILAMHSFLAPAPQANATMAGAISEASAQPEVSAALHHVVAASAVVTSGVANFAKDCAGCAGDLSMATMLCILALLTVALMLFAPRLMGRWHRQLWSLLLRLFSGPARYIAVVLPPPSLDALGISRT
ncbi:hypothetical protein GCM10027056_31480 [Glaciibacter psychrotolerans]